MVKTITLIQFHNWTEDSDDRNSRNWVNKWFVLRDFESTYEFYDGDDDDTGECIYVEKDCICYYDSFEDFTNEENEGYMVSHRLRYSTIDIDVEVDENNNIKWLVA